jgi:hypothetical protein
VEYIVITEKRNDRVEGRKEHIRKGGEKENSVKE